ncbi:MAG: ribosome recycling factor [Candidatus Brocadiia bacterium]|nr:MAG: ribosome recycling factor [Candidatus Brocadiia bacterium]
MPTQKLVSETESKMKKTVDVLHGELKSVRAGRASTGLVENLSVDYYGNPTPLKQIASMAAPQADAIVIKPFDPASIKDIEKAIKNSDLSLAPIVDGKLIRLNIPPLSQERRKQLVNQVKQLGELQKISIRNIRRDSNKNLEKDQKDGLVTEDDEEKGKKLIDDLTKKYIESVDHVVKQKTDEIIFD